MGNVQEIQQFIQNISNMIDNRGFTGNEETYSGRTPLMELCSVYKIKSITELAIKLVETGKSNPGAMDEYGDTALMESCGLTGILSKLNMQNIDRFGAPFNSMNIKLIRDILNTGESKPEQANKDGLTALIVVILNNAIDTHNKIQLINEIIDTGNSNMEQITGTFVANKYNKKSALYFLLTESGIENDNQIAEILSNMIEKGFGANIPIDISWTKSNAVYICCEKGYINTLKVLLNSNIDINQIKTSEGTALDIVISKMTISPVYIDMTNLLLDTFPDIQGNDNVLREFIKNKNKIIESVSRFGEEYVEKVNNIYIRIDAGIETERQKSKRAKYGGNKFRKTNRKRNRKTNKKRKYSRRR